VLAAVQTGGTHAAPQEETLLAAVVTMALFAVQGAHAGPARIAGPLGIAFALALGLWALAPVVLWGAVHPGGEGSDLVPLVFALCALTAVAGLAVARDRRAERRRRPTAAG